MMKPRGAGAWWTAAILLAGLAAGVAWASFDLSRPTGWLAIAFGLAAVACAVVAVRARRPV